MPKPSTLPSRYGDEDTTERDDLVTLESVKQDGDLVELGFCFSSHDNSINGYLTVNLEGSRLSSAELDNYQSLDALRSEACMKARPFLETVRNQLSLLSEDRR